MPAPLPRPAHGSAPEGGTAAQHGGFSAPARALAAAQDAQARGGTGPSASPFHPWSIPAASRAPREQALVSAGKKGAPGSGELRRK